MVDNADDQGSKIKDQRQGQVGVRDNSRVRELLTNLGLNYDEVAVCSALVGKIPISTLALARATGIPRTNVYRILESLKVKGLVAEIVDEKRTLVKAADYSRFEFLVSREKEKAASLENLLPEVKEALSSPVGQSAPDTKVLFYRGKDGLWQQVFNELRAKDEIVGYTLLSFEDIVGKKLAQKYREERLLMDIKSREILADDDKYLTSETLKYMRQSALFKNYEARYLPRQKMKINHNLVIYNDVVSFLNWYEGEIFGVEIYNRNIADLQRQIFNLLWPTAEGPETVLKRRRG